MRSENRRCEQGPYFDLSHLFSDGLFAYLTLAGFADTSPEGLSAFLAGRGHPVRRVHRVEQVHSGTVVEAPADLEIPSSADALVGSRHGEAVRVVTADCVPILLAADDGSRYTAVHAGWKGTVARIAQGAVRAMAVPPPSLSAYIGPAIGPCCYSVDLDRHRLFEAEFPGWVGVAGDRPSLDLQGLNRRQLEEAGIAPSAIRVEERCTACDVGLCCSYRRDGDRAGRMAALVGRTA